MHNRLITLFQIFSLLGLGGLWRIVSRRLLGKPTFTVFVKPIGRELTLRFNNSDLVILLGVFLHGDCEVDLDPPPATILDLGANAGLTVAALRGRFPSARIIALEPDAESFLICQGNHSDDPQTTVLRRAASAVSGVVTLADPSVIAMARQFISQSETVNGDTVAATSLNDLASEFATVGPTLVKMDIEGAEIEIFRSPSWLRSVEAVLVEPHGLGTDELICEALEAHGFALAQVGEKIYGRRAPW